jgi:hypothetical protein
MLTVAG